VAAFSLAAPATAQAATVDATVAVSAGSSLSLQGSFGGGTGGFSYSLWGKSWL
jgi:hypothetical protein